MTRQATPGGMTTFTIIWFGQLVSIFGSGLTGFGLGVWLFQENGSATQFALANFFYVMPFALVASLAGTLVDRWDRRWVMILADTGQALATLLIALLLYAGQLAVWHIYAITIVSAVLGAFQGPAYAASVSLLVPKRHLTRARGMAQLSQAISTLASPLLGGFLVITIGLEGVILIDLVTFVIAIVTLVIVRIPRPPETPEAAQAKGSLWREMIFGWQYLLVRPGLLGFYLIGAFNNFFRNAGRVLIVPLVLSIADTNVLGAVLAVGGVGLLMGGLLMSIWGGPGRRVNGALGFTALEGVALIVVGWLPNPLLVAIGLCLWSFSFSGAAAFSSAISQSKVATDVQGRVFGAVGVISLIFEAPAYPAGGFLADTLFEPLMAEGGRLAGIVGPVIGAGPGRGMGLINIIMGICMIITIIIGYLYPRIRLLEDELPDTVIETAVDGEKSTL
jgi:MFS transporter, DHA3 family, macrolide efflux protein